MFNSVSVSVLVASQIDVFDVTLADSLDELVCRIGKLLLTADDTIGFIAVPGMIFLTFLHDGVSENDFPAEVAHDGFRVGDVEPGSVGEVTHLVTPVDLHLPSVGVHGADILGRVAVAGEAWNLDTQKHVLCLFVVVVRAEAEPVAQKVHVEPEVVGPCCLPGYVLHGKIHLGGSHL